MSTGKFLNDTVLFAFGNHPRGVIKELINEAKRQRDAATIEKERDAWQDVVDQLIRTYNVSPLKS